MLEELKTAVMFLVWARFLQMLVCNQDNQKHIRGLIGLLTICMILEPFHNNKTSKINQLLEASLHAQELQNNKITYDFWEDCEKMIDSEMNGEKWKEHFEEIELDGDGIKNSVLGEEDEIHDIEIRVLLK